MSSTGVTVYSKPRCPNCESTYRDLDNKGIDYDVIDVSKDTEALKKVKDLGYLQAPVVVTPWGNWSGYRADKINDLEDRLAA